MINTVGVSGNARVINIGGDHITYCDTGAGIGTYDKVASIEERLRVDRDRMFGTFSID